MQTLMTLEEVAAYLRLSKDTLYRMAHAGKIPASKVGNQWRFLKDDVWVRLIEDAIDSEDESSAANQTSAALNAASKERAERLIALQKKASLASRLNLRAARELRDASDERRFLLGRRDGATGGQGDAWDIVNDELVLYFRYVPDPARRKQANLNAAAVDRILNLDRFEDPFNCKLDIATGTAGGLPAACLRLPVRAGTARTQTGATHRQAARSAAQAGLPAQAGVQDV